MKADGSKRTSHDMENRRGQREEANKKKYKDAHL